MVDAGGEQLEPAWQLRQHELRVPAVLSGRDEGNAGTLLRHRHRQSRGGYYFSHTVSKNGKVLGVAAVRSISSGWTRRGGTKARRSSLPMAMASSSSRRVELEVPDLEQPVQGRLWFAGSELDVEAGRLSPLR
jgi:hypothetical protein